MRRPPLRLAATIAALGPVSLVLSHNLSFLVAYGSGSEAALLATGHDARWTSAVQAVITVSAILGILALARLLSLWQTAQRVERPSGIHAPTDWPAFARTVVVNWAWLVFVTATAFLIQENLEQVSIGRQLPGLEPLLADGLVGPLLIIPAVALLVALIGSLFGWGTAVLRARIAAAMAAGARHRPRPVPCPTGALPPRSKALARNHGLRAPPAALAA